MNIFALDHDPLKAAHWHVDKHVGKMIIESNQLLSTAHWYFAVMAAGHDPDQLRAREWKEIADRRLLFDEMTFPTHINHPCAKWVRESKKNYDYLVELAQWLSVIWEVSKMKVHGSSVRLIGLRNAPEQLQDVGLTDFVTAMPEEYKTECTVESYRNYYREGKKHLHKWTIGQKPDWI